jgi:hypothetical protein
MKICIIVEGKTEQAFKPVLVDFLRPRLEKMPKLDFHQYKGCIPTKDKLRRVVEMRLAGKNAADHVIALTDVYTGPPPYLFQDAFDAKSKMRRWVGDEPRFHPHAAQYDFEAWLLPYWNTIQDLTGHAMNVPSGNPESVNHGNSPAYRIKEMFELGKKCRDSYVKPRDAGRILRENDLTISIAQCAELKAFVNTILSLSGGALIP